MNAHAVKRHLRERLQQRKFELEHLEWSYRSTLSENRITHHTESSTRRQEPGIAKLAKTYNSLCEQLVSLIKSGGAPQYAVALLPVQQKGLFQLDVNDTVWQDLGLDSGEDSFAPPWLISEDVRRGISWILDFDRCAEEESRLQHERSAMQEWFWDEWRMLQLAQRAHYQDDDILYQLQQWQEKLCRLCFTWQSHTHEIPVAQHTVPEWGPSEAMLHTAVVYEFTGSLDEQGQHEADDDEDVALFGEDEEGLPPGDDEVLEVIESVAFMDAYHHEDDCNWECGDTDTEPPSSPVKRVRFSL